MVRWWGGETVGGKVVGCAGVGRWRGGEAAERCGGGVLRRWGGEVVGLLGGWAVW